MPESASAIWEPFGEADGEPVFSYRLTGTGGLQVEILNYGCIIRRMMVPDAQGQMRDVVLGFDHLEPYLMNPAYFGCIVGRCANRIACGRFTLDGQEYRLSQNDAPNHLHGGFRGFSRRVWHPVSLAPGKEPSVAFSYRSPDGEEGYPGTLSVIARFTVKKENALEITLRAVTSRPTIVNLTHHSYFNFKDGGISSILDHHIRIEADAFTPVGPTLIPTGDIFPVQRTPFDFRHLQPIGTRIGEADEQLQLAGGYDHNFVLRGQPGTLRRAATVVEPCSGIAMELFTTAPGLQFYTGNFLDGSLRGKQSTIYHKHAGFCLEPQHFPDSPNHPHFPPVVLRPGQEYRSQIIFKFAAKRPE